MLKIEVKELERAIERFTRAQLRPAVTAATSEQIDNLCDVLAAYFVHFDPGRKARSQFQREAFHIEGSFLLRAGYQLMQQCGPLTPISYKDVLNLAYQLDPQPKLQVAMGRGLPSDGSR